MSHKIYLGVPTGGKKPREYAAHLHTQVHILFGMAYRNRGNPVTDAQINAFLEVNRFQDELIRIAFPPRRK